MTLYFVRVMRISLLLSNGGHNGEAIFENIKMVCVDLITWVMIVSDCTIAHEQVT